MHSFDPFNIFGNAKTLRFVIKNIELWNRANSFHSNQSVDNELDLATWLGVGQDQGCEIRRSSKLGWSTRHLIFNTFEFLLPIKIFTTAAAIMALLLNILHTQYTLCDLVNFPVRKLESLALPQAGSNRKNLDLQLYWFVTNFLFYDSTGCSGKILHLKS